MNAPFQSIAYVLLAAFCSSLLAKAAEPTRAQLDFFESKIRPIFVSHCYECHSHEAPKLKGGLSLEFRDGWARGGDTGPVIVAGDPDHSLLIKAVRYGDPDLQMPPKGAKLSESQIADLSSWIKMGAPDPRVAIVVATVRNTGEIRDHWAFKPIHKQAVPPVRNPAWVQNPIDAFIASTLDAAGMKPNPPADKRTLIRRATFDLIGLPPTPEEVQEFLTDQSPQAFAKVVDRLLASPHYGERWGRFWLDTARYSDTKGDVKRNKEDYHFPNAWTYRDYVVRTFNEDKPFNEFILEQMAAERLPATKKDPSILAALGFLTLGDRFNDNNNDIINDRIDVVSKGFLGLTVTCSRCHDHKFDPIPTADYYSLRGVFASSVEPAVLPIISHTTNGADYSDFFRKYVALTNQLVGLAKERRASRLDRDREKAKIILRQEVGIRSDLSELEMNHPGAPARAVTLVDARVPKDSPIFIRGEAENQGEIVPRRFLEVLSPTNRSNFKTGSGRLDLAQAIASPSNPLTARVYVNRVWMHHFGEGFVPTPDDFGTQSAPPSHPQLLDYLAVRFMDEGWSSKKLHRLIMLSNTYQQSSAGNAQYAELDPNNRLLWRANTRRLDFEAIRDSLLAIGDNLDETIGGRPVNLGTFPYSTRRTLYGFIDRRNLPEVYNQFDFANPDLSTGKRYETIVPQQSLFLMNSPLVIHQAIQLVARPDFQELGDMRARVKLLYEIVYQREPLPEEITIGLDFVYHSPDNEPLPKMAAAVRQKVSKRKAERLQASFASLPPGELKPLTPWERYAHALLQANDAIFLR